MTGMQKITRLSISTHSIEPPRGIIEIETTNSILKFELNEDLAHALCTDLEHFLTQVPERTRSRARLG